MLDHAIPHRPRQTACHWSITRRGLFSVPDAILPVLGVLLGQFAGTILRSLGGPS